MKRFIVFFSVLLFSGIPGLTQNSVLSTGEWYKITVSQTGVYKIGYNDLVTLGIEPSGINPKHIKLYGNGSGMLPEANSEFRYDDLMENAIFVKGEDDGTFDPDDYILFYGEGPVVWKYNDETSEFEHISNIYTDKTCYFLTISGTEGKRIDPEPTPAEPANQFKSTFQDFYLHEQDIFNPVHSGKKWYGEEVIANDFIEFNINLQDIDLSQPVFTRIALMARAFDINNTINLYVDDILQKSTSIPSVNSLSLIYGREKTESFEFYPQSGTFTLKTEFVSEDSSLSWLDYFTFNYTRELNYQSGGLAFRCPGVTGAGNITEFQLSNCFNEVIIWDVTDPLNIKQEETQLNGNILSFKANTEELREFYAFDHYTALTPSFDGQIANQNLHSLEPADIIIVAYDNFTGQAQQLADFHLQHDGLTSILVTPQQIYNEFSSGVQDVTAIRDFIKYIYDKDGTNNKPQYLLLFGAASYDYKDRVEDNTNFVPVWESTESLNSVASICTDDFFGCLDNNEGPEGTVDIGIGRMPARNVEEAQNYVNKVIHYATSEEMFGNWKNEITFIADDGDNSLHIEQAENLTEILPVSQSVFNTSKTYLDLYELVQTPEGPRYPEVNQSINQQIEEGRFIVNYTGHGNSDGWAQEKVLTKEDVESWTNYDRLPVICAATCDFIRFDDPGTKYCGISIADKANGGAIALISATRMSYASSNFLINQYFLEFIKSPGENPTLGNLTEYFKQNFGKNNLNVWHLIGDPALKMAYPKYSVKTETVNGVNAGQPLDTIHPGDQIVITGSITGDDGNQISNFTGEIHLKVFGIAYTRTTNGNNGGVPVEITLQDSIIAEASTTVTNGNFEAAFTVPLTISQEFGNIKISYYASNNETDASGYFADLVTGGEPSGTSNIIVPGNFNVYPTITSGLINIVAKYDEYVKNIKVFDITGTVVNDIPIEKMKAGEKFKLDLHKLKPGIYFLNILTENQIANYKIIKK